MTTLDLGTNQHIKLADGQPPVEGPGRPRARGGPDRQRARGGGGDAELASRSGWYSAKVRLACLLERDGLCRYQDSVIVFQAGGFPEAFQRALDIGRAHEEEYVNADGERVAWRLKEVFSLDVIQAGLDGAEVYSEPVEAAPSDRAPFDMRFEPERSEPTQTI